MTGEPRTRTRGLSLIVLCLNALAVMPLALYAATTFIGSTIMDIGADGRTVTIRTMQGESWSLEVVEPAVTRGVQKGDQVSLEVDAQDRVHKIVKITPDLEPPASGGHRGAD